ncbi:MULTISPECIES: EscU/YscU/HrcU family type III secretion system export apparatus switch protein [unclassified Pseudomonas]|uniref:EscU/YscU/HrcU family type III secretion system export apparatus switch protein n=1 Tax=unclassified Pseudomonas TaxID=196821 RepID=UPI001914B241|nr:MULTISPECIES: EscU/YscU/HrcU family type III secretion system export apparatus switch protein [unclassified Pseudomonas]MBK5551480.1 EscU/YscU/HrcU family type III secretion system export apparatus switch protein [Pseudomonas sp. TH03]MEB0224443.1 EscU/YscU/HrcU family type III secretion system export apparatus switch protein [Pseudomonas sp. 5S1]MEB0294294.1 EscU/YscU/HrcU family type III secretion system export apparatus switch protein [Pseudomonas sp. 10S4]WPX15900.1 EscU/YscU/HrcU family
MNNPNTPRQAIALKYDGTHAPTLTAKGDDALAEAILKIARDYEVPIYENPELVRLLARMELGESIPQELYRTIAEIIAFAWNLKGKFPAGHDPNAPVLEKNVTERGDDY